MKTIALFLGIFLVPFLNYAQTKQPDTLQVEIKPGQKIILIGADLNSFKTVKADSIIKKALFSIQDSIPKGKRSEYIKLLSRKRLFVLQPGIGVGLVRDKISPFLGMALDFAPQRQDYYTKNWGDEYTFINVAANAFYSFEQDPANQYHTYTNIFIEGSIGNRVFNNRIKHSFKFDEFSFGAGYLIRNRGSYFNANTFKLFVSAIPNNSLVRLRPEILLADDFKEIFPGINVSAKLFGKTPFFQNRHIHKKNKQRMENMKANSD